jgi:hypothetical protein
MDEHEFKSSAVTFLEAAAILGRRDLVPVWVEVPEWGGGVFVRAMTGRERDAFEAAGLGGGKKFDTTNFRARLAAATVCDAQGALLFAPHQADALGEKSSGALNRIFEVAAPLSGLTQEDEDALTKN